VKRRFYPSIVFIFFFSLTGCIANNPYSKSEKFKNIFYTTFNEPPKHLDPARSYSSNEYDILGQVYEPPLQYHYLKVPYELIPLAAERVPQPVYLDKNGEKLPQDVSPERVRRAIYEIRIKKGIMYQNHPAFAKNEGSLIYHNLKKQDVRAIKGISDFPIQGTRELTSDDFICQIKRLADPTIQSPILPILEKYILGLKEYADALKKDFEEKRGNTPDYKKYPLPGVEKVDDYTFRIILRQKYPQFVYWLAMPFFSPMPEEAVSFYRQGVLEEKNITIDRLPVGTGPFRMERYLPQREIVLVKNENFHGETYPEEGEPGDKEKGLLNDSGKNLPFMEMLVFKLEKEDIPRWGKFLQGYYDTSGITSDSFDQAISLSAEGRAAVTDRMKEKGISLITSVRPSTYYMGFNMLDNVVGGYTEDKRKLRRAISIALDSEEYIEIFNNGRGIPAMGPLPPGTFGHLEGSEGINPFVYNWDKTKDRPVRKSIEEAKELLREAGYPGGRDKDGHPLVITFDNPWTGADAVQMINWYIKRLKLLGIQIENRTTDYNRFQEKMLKGNFQFFAWGWNADYPDPENFFFLLAGPAGKVRYQGENAANYENPEFDRLFRMMENMDNTPERLALIKKMTGILRDDSPWVWGFHPVAFTLAHRWIYNLKPNPMVNNGVKYIRLDPEKRASMREDWNSPVVWPVFVLLAVVFAASIPAVISLGKKMGLTGR